MAGEQDQIDQLLQATTVAPQPSFMGLQAPPDPAQLQALLGKLRQQQYQEAATRPTGGQYGYLHDAGNLDAVQAGSSLGNMLTAPGGLAGPGPNQPPQPSQNQSATGAAIMQAKQAYAAMIQHGVDPDQAAVTAVKMMNAAGVPNADAKLSEVYGTQLGNAFKKSETAKDTAQAAMDNDEIKNRAFDQSTKTWKTTFTDPKGLYMLQTNAQGETRRVEMAPPPSASAQAANSITPDAMKGMLDFYHTNGTIPPGLARSPAAAAKFWEAEAAYQQQTGNYASAATANKMQLHALNTDTANIQKQLGATSSYLNTMDKNIEAARNLGNQIDFSDATPLNKALQLWDKKTSDPKYAKYNAFFNSVAVEYAKLSSGNMGNTTVSDSQRHETQAIIDSAIGNGGMNAVFDALKQEGENKVDGYKIHLAANMNQMQGVGSAARNGLAQFGAPQTPAAPTGNVVDFSSLK